MNKLLNEKYISVKGKENAFELAEILIINNYQVMIQYDDCNIYIVAYAPNDPEYGDKFALLNEAETEIISTRRREHRYDEDDEYDEYEDDEYDEYDEYDDEDDEDEEDEENNDKLD